jgi:hypothetical protein
MRSPWTELFLAAGVGLHAAPGRAQQTLEYGVQAALTSSQPAMAVLGPYGALRTSGRTRISASLGGGTSDGEFAWRAEGLGQFMVSPTRRSGWGPYLAAGLAAVGGPINRGYIVFGLGAEDRPGASSGWAAEIGVGGGLRFALGYRWRRLPGASGD